MTSPRPAFKGTRVSAGTTQGQITDLLRKRGHKTQWTDETGRTVLRFVFKAYGQEIVARFDIVYPRTPPAPRRGRPVPIDVRGQREIDRVFRCTLAWFKGQFAAVDAGLRTLAEVFSPLIELPGGHTVGSVIPQLAAGGKLALPAPESTPAPAQSATRARA